MLITGDNYEVIDTLAETTGPGRYLDPMACYLDQWIDQEDEFRGDFSTYGCGTRFGRRILWVDCMGFIRSERYPDADAAQAALFDAFPEEPEPETDECPEHGTQEVTGHGVTVGPDPYDITNLACGHRVICLGPGEPNVTI